MAQAPIAAASSMSATARLYPNQVPPVPVQQQYQQQQQQYNAQLHQQQIRQQQQAAAAAAAAQENMYSNQANYYHPGKFPSSCYRIKLSLSSLLFCPFFLFLILFILSCL